MSYYDMSGPGQKDNPNIVIIYVDDLGYGDVEAIRYPVKQLL